MLYEADSYNVDERCTKPTSYNGFFQRCMKHGVQSKVYEARDLATLYEAGFVVRCFVQRSKMANIQSQTTSYNFQKLSTLYEFTSYNVDVVRGTTVHVQNLRNHGRCKRSFSLSGRHISRRQQHVGPLTQGWPQCIRQRSTIGSHQQIF